MKTIFFTKGAPILSFALISMLSVSCSEKELPQPKKVTAEQTSEVSCNADVQGTISASYTSTWGISGEMHVYKKISSEFILIGTTPLGGYGTGIKEVFYGEVVDDELTGVALPCMDIPMTVGETYYLRPVLNAVLTSYGAWYIYESRHMLAVTFTSANHGKLRFDYDADFRLASDPDRDTFVLSTVGANIIAKKVPWEGI